MKVYIARGGKEVGAWREQDLADRARAGDILPTDQYWKDGMSNWQPLESLLGAEIWAPVGKSAPRAASFGIPEFLRQPRTLAILGACSFCVVVGFAIYFAHASSLRSKEAQQAKAAAAERESEAARDQRLREHAIAELHQKVEKLPDKPTPGSNVFYYGFNISFTNTSSAFVPWMATISGVEEVVDPETNQTLWRSNFVLETDYRREWTFRHYRAVTTDMKDGSTRQEEAEGTSLTMPMVANNLGLVRAEPSKRVRPAITPPPSPPLGY